jgi:gliding motility-associated-like protein
MWCLLVPVGTGVRANDNDAADGNPVTSLTVTATPLTGPSNGTLAGGVIGGNGSFTYTPGANFSGLDSFVYVVCDNGTPLPSLCDTATAYITVTGINDPPFIPDTSVTTCEDCPVNICIPFTDADVSDVHSYAVLCNATNGTVSNVSINNITDLLCLTYVGNQNFNGSDSICIVVCDNGVPTRCDTTKITITVTPVNDPPVAINDNYSTVEDVTIVIPVATGVRANDNDAADNNPNSSLTITTTPICGPVTGSVTLNANGSFTYVPLAGFSGIDSFCYVVCDAGSPLPSLCDTGVAFINIGSVNDPPVVNDTVVTTCEDCPITVCLPFTDEEASDVHSIAVLCNPLHGSLSNVTVSDITDQICFTYTGVINYNGADSLCIVICDNGTPSRCDTSTIRITITPVNDPPIAINDNYSTQEDVTLNIPVGTGVRSNDNDNADGNPVTSLTVNPVTVSGPSNGTLTLNTNGSFIYVPTTNFVGADTFYYSVCDAGTPPPSLCDTAMVVINVSSVNDPPFIPDTTITTCEDCPVTLCIPFADADVTDLHSFAQLCNPVNGAVTNVTLSNITDQLCFTYTGTLNFNGADSLCFVVCDNGIPSRCDTATIRITVTPVNDPPVALNDNYSTTEDVVLTVPVGTGVRANDNDNADGNPVTSLTVTATTLSGPSNGTLSGGVLNGNGSFTYTPNSNFSGLDSFVYIVCDNGTPLPSLCDTATAYITVNGINDPPVVVDTPIVVCEDCGPITVCIPVVNNDPGQTVNVAAQYCGPNSGTANVSLVINTLCVTYTSQANFNGLDSICLVVCDNGSPVLCDTTKITITVTPVNDPPVAVNDNYSTTEDVTLNIPVATGVRANDNDALDGNPVTSLTITPSVGCGPFNGSLTLNTNGSFTYVPNAGYFGLDSFCYSVCDNGTPLPSLCDTGVAYITINQVNDPPVVIDTPITTCEDCPITVCTPFSDADTVDIHTAVVLCNPTAGTVSNIQVIQGGIVNQLCFTYTPYANVFGQDSMCIVVCDNGVPSLCDTTYIPVTVTPTNDPPYIDTIYVVTYENQPIGVNVSAAAGDLEGDPLTFTYGAVTPGGGTYAITGNGAIVVTPAPGFTGTFAIPDQVCDNSPYLVNVLCDNAAIIVTVLPAGDTLVNHAPIANNDYVTTPINNPVVINQLANDYDVDGDALAVTITGGPSHGSITLNANGSVNYTPFGGYYGFDTISYTICDPTAQNNPKPLCDNAIIVISISRDSISNTNDPPVAVDDFAFICSDATTTLRLLLNDSDPNGDALTSVSIIDNLNNGTLTAGSLGIYLYDPNIGFNGYDTLIYRVCDNGSPALCDTALAVVQVFGNPVLIPSVANAAICSGDSLKIDFTSNIPGTAITWTATNGTSGTGNIATVLVNVTSGPQTVTYNVVGVAPGGCGSTTVTIPVTINPEPVATFNANGTIFCSGDNVVINVASNVVSSTYTWSSSLGANGTGSIISDNPVNNGTTNITVTYSIVPLAAGCAGDTLNVSVVVKPKPVLTVNPSSQTVCSGTSISIAIGTSIPGTTFNWTGSNSSSGNTSPINDSPVNPSAAPIVVTYNVNGSFNGCPANNVSATVTVRPAVITNAGNDQNAVSCSGSCVTLGGSPTGTGGQGVLTYAWTPSTGLNSTTASNPQTCNLPSTTTYTVVVTDAFNCSSSDQVTITITPSSLTAEAGAGGAICGNGDSIQLGGIPTAVGGNAPYSYTWSPLSGLNLTNLANPSAKPTVTTKYFVTVTDQLGCSSVDSATVFVNQPMVADAGLDSTICNGQVVVIGGNPTVSGGSGTYTYQWSPSTFLSSGTASNPSANPSGNVTYFVTATDGNGCTASDFMTITVRPNPTAFAGADKDLFLCPGDSVIIGDVPAATGGLAPYTYSWSPATGIVTSTSNSNPVVKGLATAQTYVLVVTDANGCSSTDAVTVNVRPNNLTANAGLNRQICFGNTVQLGNFPTLTGGTAPYAYDWNNGTSLNDSTVSNPVANPTTTTTYVVIVSDANGCSASSSATVTVNPNPVTNAGPDTTVCIGSVIAIGGSPTASSGTPGYTYTWTPTLGLSSAVIANPSAAPIVATTYSVLVTDSKGCSSFDDVVVTPRPTPVVDAGSDKSIVACAADTAFMLTNISGGTSPYTFAWTPSTALSSDTVQNPYVTGLAVTTSYQLVVTDVYGCQGVDFVIVNVTPSTLQADAGTNNNICASAGTPVAIGGVPTAVGGTSPYTFAWASSPAGFSSALANPTALPLVSTTYYVTVTDSKGCSSVDSVRVNVNAAPSANAGLDTALCQGFCAVIGGTPAGSGGTSPLQYSWTPTIGLDANNIPNPLACPLVTTTYVVQVTDSNGCIATDQVLVVVRPLPVANAGVDKSLVSCSGDTVTIGGTPASSGGTGALTCTWSPGTGLSSTTACNPYVTGITTSQLYTLVVIDVNGCRAEDAVLITVTPSTLTAEAGTAASVCAGSNASVSLGGAPTAQGGSAPYSYAWSPSATLSSATSANPSATPVSTTKYFVTVTDGKGCVAIDSVTITVNPAPVACAGPDTAICAGAKVYLGCLQTASGSTSPYTYLWSNGSTSANPLVGVTATTIFTVTVTDANGCTGTDSKLVTVNANPNADAGLDQTLTACSSDSVQIGGSPSASGGTAPYVYVWVPAGGLSDDSIANPWAKGLGSTINYNLIVTDANGCFDNDQVTVVVNNPTLQAEAGNNVAFCAGAAVSITLGGTPTAQGTTPPYTYVWSSNPAGFSSVSPNPTVSPTESTTYYVDVIDANGCSAFDSVRITINPRPIVSAGVSDTICVGASVSLGGQPTASGGTGSTYTYNWTPTLFLSSPTVSNPIATPSGTLTWQVTATDSLGCSNSSNVTIRVNQNPVANGGGPFNVVSCPDACVIIGGVPTATGGTAPYLYAWAPAGGLNNTGLANPAACNLAQSITYSVTVTDINGCTSSASSPVNVTVSTLTADAGADKSICAGQSGCVSIGGTSAVSGGTGPYLIDWSPVAGICDFNNVPNPTVNPTDTTTYVLLVQDALGCIAIDSMVLYANPAVTAIMNPDTAICSGGVANLGGTPNTADGGTAPFTYSWNPTVGLVSSPNISNPAASPAVSTVYCVTVTDAVGCSSSACQQILVNPGVIADAGNPTTVVACGGSFHTLGGSPSGSGGTGNYSYAWSPDSVGGVKVLNGRTIPNPILTGLTQTTVFTLTVTDNTTGCFGTDSVLITVIPTTLTVEAGSDKVFCLNSSSCVQVGGSPTAQGGAFPYIYQWSPIGGLDNPNIANPCANPLSTTKYLLTVTDANGCVAVDSMSVIVSPLVTVNAGLDSFLCTGSTINLGGTPTGAGGTGILTYNWSAGAFPSNSANPSVSPTANTTYSVTVTDSLGCSATDAMDVVLRARPVANAGPDATIFACSLDSAILGGTPTGSGTQQPYTYLWDNPTGLNSTTVSNPVLTNVGNNQVYCVVVRDAFGCQSLPDCMNLTANPPSIFVNAGANSSLCSNSGGCVNLSGIVTGTGVAPFNYLWSGGPLTNPTSLNTQACPDTTTAYTLLVTDANGCASSDTTVVTVNAPPVASITGLNAAYCANAGNITLTGVPAGGIFSGPFVTGNIFQVNAAGPGLWCIRYTYQQPSTGCIDDTVICVNVNPLPVVSISVQNPSVCSNGAVQILTGTPAGGVFSGPGIQNGNEFNPSTAVVGNNTITYTYFDSIAGCGNTATVVINVKDNPQLTISASDDTVCVGQSTSLSAAYSLDVFNIVWSRLGGAVISSGFGPISINPSAIDPTAVDFCVVATAVNTPNGCQTSDTICLHINQAPVAAADTANTCEEQSVQIAVLGNDADPEGDAGVVTILSASNGTATVSNGVINYTPATDYNGNASITYQVCNSNCQNACDTADVFISICPINDTPVVDNPIDTIYENDTSIACPVVTDVDAGDAYTLDYFACTTLNGTVTENDTCVTFVPTPGWTGTQILCVSVCDTSGACDTSTITVVVLPINNAPVAQKINVIVCENTSIGINVGAACSDPDGDLLTFTYGPVLGAPAGANYTFQPTGNGTVVFSSDSAGIYTIPFLVCDTSNIPQFSLCDTQVIIISVVACDSVNNAPVANDDAVVTTVSTPIVINELANDFDPDGDPLNVTIISGPSLPGATATLNPDGTINYNSPTVGVDVVCYSICDPDGLCDTACITIFVDSTVNNNHPPLATDDFTTTDYLTPITIDLTKNDSDPDGNTLVVGPINVPCPPQYGTTVQGPGGTVIYTPGPLANANQPDTFCYVICDVAIPTLCDTAVVVVYINNSVQGVAECATTGSFHAVTFDVIGNDFDPEGDSFSVTSVIPMPITIGAVTLNNDGTITYVPDQDTCGFVDSFQYVITDVQGATDTVTVCVDVICCPRPVAVNDAAVTIPESQIAVVILANDTTGNDPSLTVDFTQNGGPSHGTATLDTARTLFYTPDADWCGFDTIEYYIETRCGFDTAIVVIETYCNIPPVANADTITICTNAVSDLQLLVNDTDSNGNVIFITGTSVAQPGTLGGITAQNATSVQFTSLALPGTATFTYFICDNGIPSYCDTNTVVLNIIACTPIQVDTIFDTTFVNVPDTICLDGLVTSSTPWTITSLCNPQNGTVDVLTGDTCFVYTPALNFVGNDTFCLVVCDTFGNCDTTPVIITVLDPTIIAVDEPCEFDSTSKNTPITIRVLLNDDLPFGSDTTVAVLQPVDNATAVVNNDNTITVTPATDYSGNITFSYEVCVTSGSYSFCDTAQVCVVVEDSIECFLPNGFSPNGDAVNDAFVIPCNTEYPDASLIVYNRWGVEVWNSEGPYQNNFEGKNMQGVPLPDGTYYFLYYHNDGTGDVDAKFVVIHR